MTSLSQAEKVSVDCLTVELLLVIRRHGQTEHPAERGFPIGLQAVASVAGLMLAGVEPLSLQAFLAAMGEAMTHAHAREDDTHG
jgi:hypothetical protein